MKKSIIFTLLLTFTVTATAIILTGCNYGKENPEKPLILPQSTSDEILTVISGCQSDARYEDDTVVDDELPPEEFIGTIIEEEQNCIIVVPNTDEKEYELAKKIRIDYNAEYKDYFYGTGRTVLITYIPHINVKDGIGYIKTDSIDTKGFEDFEIFTVADDSKNATFVINGSEINMYNSDCNLYYYGLSEVFITVDGKTLPLANALRLGKVTLDGIISKCNTLAALGEIEVLEYKDGGSKLYRFDSFSILKFHTLDGNRDIYIGTDKMDINSIGSAMHLLVGIHDVYGLDIIAKDVSPSGLTLVYEKREGGETGSLQFGDYYEIERLSGSHWEKVPYSEGIEDENIVWHMVAYMINDFAPYSEQTIDWSYLYGKLDCGTYRIVKDIMDFRSTGDFDEFEAYCYFDIKDGCTAD